MDESVEGLGNEVSLTFLVCHLMLVRDSNRRETMTLTE